MFGHALLPEVFKWTEADRPDVHVIPFSQPDGEVENKQNGLNSEEGKIYG
jgi:hypothetical protein